MAQRLEDIVEGAKERLLGLQEVIDKVVGDMPYGGRKMNPNEQMAKYLLGRDDVTFWQAMILERQTEHGLAPDVLPRDIDDYVTEMEKRLERRIEVQGQ